MSFEKRKNTGSCCGDTRQRVGSSGIIELWIAHMYSENVTWKLLQEFLPQNNRIDSVCPEETFLPYNDTLRVHLDVYNKANPKNCTIIMLHGVGGNGRLLSFIAVPLAKRGFKIVCPDLPGYGCTTYSQKITYQTWIDIGTFLVMHEAKNDAHIFVMGLSAGGMLAYHCCTSKTAGLIVTNILDNREPEVLKYSAKNALLAKYGLPLMYKMPSCIQQIKLPIKWVTNMNGLVNNKKILKLLLKDTIGAGSSVSINFLLTMMMHTPSLDADQFNTVPALLVHPEKDNWTPMAASELFFDKIQSQKTKVILENAGHFPIEKPGIEQLENAIVDFVQKIIK
jgi:alpha-beta hydrolase superfamily lysophospholipase